MAADLLLPLFRKRRAAGAVFVVVTAVNVLLLWHFHDRYWYPIDEGIYAIVAEHLLSGDVLHVDIQDFHLGYGEMLNAAAFRLFGVDLVSLRYPLIAGALLQSWFVFAVLYRGSLLLASSAAVASIALGVLHFLNPTPHWYALFGTCALIYWMTAAPRAGWRGLLVTGFLVGAITLFHQLVGVLVGAGVLVVTLQEQSDDARGGNRLVGQILVAVVLAGLVFYLARSPAIELGGVLLFAAWPLAIMVRSLKDLRAANAAAAHVALLLTCGALLSATPLLVYCGVHNSCRETISEGLFGAWSFGVRSTDAPSWYAAVAVSGLLQAMAPSTAGDFVRGLFWIVLPLLSAANGVLTLTADDRQTWIHPLPVLSAFHAVSSLFLQDTIYLFFSAGLSMAAVLWWLSERPRIAQILGGAAATALSGVAIAFYAGQPSIRTTRELLSGTNAVLDQPAAPLRRATLRLSEREQYPYADLVNIIQMNVAPGAPIFAVPNDSTLYFLTDRPNPFRFTSTAWGIQNTADLDAVLDRLRTDPPRLVTFRPDDQYNTSFSLAIMDYVRGHYDRLDAVGGVEVYLLRQPRTL